MPATPSNGPPIAGKSIKRLLINAGRHRGSGIMVPSPGKRKVLFRERHISCAIDARDRGVKKVFYTSSTTLAIEHMKDQHQWNSDCPIPRPEGTSITDQILPDAQATFSLVSKTRVAFFRKLLLQVICTGRLLLIVVESER